MEETFTLMPKEKLGVLLKSEDTFEVTHTNGVSKDKVLIDVKMIPTGEYSHVFTNTKDSPVILTIFRN